jgi:hypothetical protein
MFVALCSARLDCRAFTKTAGDHKIVGGPFDPHRENILLKAQVSRADYEGAPKGTRVMAKKTWTDNVEFGVAA